MNKRIIDHWAQLMVDEEFVWGITDCHQLMYQFVKLCNPNWKDSYRVGALTGTYSTWREANEVAKRLDLPGILGELGYKERPVNRVEAGDIVKVETNSRAYDLYMPVVFGQTILVSDARTRKIRLRHIAEVDQPFTVYRRTECHS